MAESIYYEKPVLLNRDKHRSRRIRPAPGFGFARQANSLYLAGVEFNEACKEYAIVFTRQPGGRVAPVVVLGLRERENLFVDADGHWGAAYVPAFVRRYPFVLAELPGEQLGVCIDEAFSGVNDTEGEALFDAEGGNTPYLQNALDFLQRYQQEYLRTQAFCQRIEELGLLTEMNAKADLVDGRTFTVAGLMIIDEQKLAALPDEQVLSLFRTGELHLVSMHLLSLSNLQRLVGRIAQRQGPAPAPQPAAAADPVSAPPKRAGRAGTKPG
jgi:hypothetical protein